MLKNTFILLIAALLVVGGCSEQESSKKSETTNRAEEARSTDGDVKPPKAIALRDGAELKGNDGVRVSVTSFKPKDDYYTEGDGDRAERTYFPACDAALVAVFLDVENGRDTDLDLAHLVVAEDDRGTIYETELVDPKTQLGFGGSKEISYLLALPEAVADDVQIRRTTSEEQSALMSEEAETSLDENAPERDSSSFPGEYVPFGEHSDSSRCDE